MAKLKIVQTFWSGGKDLLQDGFGWRTPQYHIMAWALSCLRLREYYDEVELHTDTPATALFRDTLGLPYTHVCPDLDDMRQYHPQVWAMAKIKTYARQDRPFLHVDGDVFLWKKFDAGLEAAPLVAQNLEMGTDACYGKMLQKLAPRLLEIPDFLQEELNRRPVGSYNAGIFGGCDLDFIRRYCSAAESLVNANRALEQAEDVIGKFNILFEQILFYALVKKEHQRVHCYYPDTFTDDGYLFKDFGDFAAAPLKIKYLHLIGAHKRRKDACALLARTLLRDYPDYFFRIVSLFRDKHVHFDTRILSLLPAPPRVNKPVAAPAQALPAPPPRIAKELLAYEIRLQAAKSRWSAIPNDELYALEQSSGAFFPFLDAPRDHQLRAGLSRNPHLEVIEDSFAWDISTKIFISDSLNTPWEEETYGFALVPELFFEGYTEVPIDALCYNILAALDEPMTLETLLEALGKCFSEEDMQTGFDAVYELALLKLRFLLQWKCVQVSGW